jgi:hypothetical protein
MNHGVKFLLLRYAVCCVVGGAAGLASFWLTHQVWVSIPTGLVTGLFVDGLIIRRWR